jgi:N-acetylneuraminate synthase
MQAVDLLESLDVAAWKVGSGELTTLPLLERMASTGRPVILSSGMASWEELDCAVKIVQKRSTVAVLQCTTAYPCPAEKIGLNLIDEMRRRYQVPVGLSDHSGTIYAGLAAASLGADLLEFHVVFSRDCFGPDVPASLTIDETNQLVQGVRFIEQAIANPLDKQQVAAEMTELKIIFGKSVVAARDLPSGHLLAHEDLTLKKPGTGIPAAKLCEVIGKRLNRGVPANSLLSEADLD